MLLGQCQSMLSELYDLDLSYDVHDFLISDAAVAASLDVEGRDSAEKLLISESDGQAEVCLYLRDELMQRLAENDPWKQINDANLADFWTAFEGVSHFMHFTWRASVDRPVSLLELELQAEVDKFVATAILMARQGARLPGGLHHWLFERCRFVEGLGQEELARYERANYYAGKYCHRLRMQIDQAGQRSAVRNELRRFCRLPMSGKIDCIEAC